MLALTLGMALAAQAEVEADLSKPFDHDTHLKLDKTCSDCHTLEADGGSFLVCESPRMPYPRHDKCISCHASGFFEKPLAICTSCHTGAALTEQAPLKEQGRAEAPLRTVFNHKLHLRPGGRVKKRFKRGKDCAFCHPFVRGGARVRLPEHAQCCECHTKKNVEPNINDCAKCHRRPKHEVNPRSLVRKFSHANHRVDPETNRALPCQRCHFQVPRAKRIATLKLPVMATCVGCHTGEVAFSYAECLKCHEKGIESRDAPASHPTK